MYKTVSSINKDTLTSVLPVCILFIPCFGLDILVKTSNIMLDRSRENEHPCFVSDFTGNALTFTPFNIMYAAGLLNIACILLIYVPASLYSSEF